VKISKEIKTGVIAILAIGLLVAGINFLKGNSFFGGDEVYHAYFPNSGGTSVAGNVMVNGVIVGKITKIELTNSRDSLKKVKITFNIQQSGFKIPKGSTIEAGALDLFNKGLIIHMNPTIAKGYYSPGDILQGVVNVDITTQVKAYADPLVKKVQTALTSIDNMVTNLTAFWDTTATSEIKGSFKELKSAIHNLGSVASQVESMVAEEKIKFSRIMSNVESISANLRKSNDQVAAIIGNAKKITDDLTTSNYKEVINNASSTLKSLNGMLDKVQNGDGTLSKLLNDQKMYNDLLETNKELQNLVNDLQVHPERYIHFSVLGAKTKGVPLTNNEEKKLRKLLDSIPD
jgi:phospholipid/cholesterol/gamma-HCH transport system substrate-binding protein